MTQFHEFPVPYTYRIQLFWKSGSTNIGGSRTYWQYSAGTISAANLGQVAATAGTSWTNHMASITHQNVTLDRIIVTDLNSGDGAQATNSVKAAGSEPGTELPVSNAVLVNYNIGTRYRGGKPKNFIVAGAAPDTTDGKHWTSNFLNLFTAAWGQWLSDMKNPGIGFSINQVAVSYYSGHQPDPTPTTWGPVNVPKPRDLAITRPVTGFAANSMIGMQRRRLRHEA